MWKRFVIEVNGEKYFVVAKVYDQSSACGINGGRVSKMQICKGSHWDYQSAIYDYDRGLSFNKAPSSVVSTALARATS